MDCWDECMPQLLHGTFIVTVFYGLCLYDLSLLMRVRYWSHPLTFVPGPFHSLCPIVFVLWGWAQQPPVQACLQPFCLLDGLFLCVYLTIFTFSCWCPGIGLVSHGKTPSAALWFHSLGIYFLPFCPLTFGSDVSTEELGVLLTANTRTYCFLIQATNLVFELGSHSIFISYLLLKGVYWFPCKLFSGCSAHSL